MIGDKAMEFQTKYFGAVEADAEDFITFPKGLFGFEDEHQFLLLPFHASAGSLLCLQSINTPALAFVAVDPFTLLPSYAPVLEPEELRALGAQSSGELGYYTFCVVKDPVGQSTVNLKCPLAIHPQTRIAQQVILDTQEYEMRHPLAQFSAKGGAPC